LPILEIPAPAVASVPPGSSQTICTDRMHHIPLSCTNTRNKGRIPQIARLTVQETSDRNQYYVHLEINQNPT
jgi:hypothetical protein